MRRLIVSAVCLAALGLGSSALAAQPAVSAAKAHPADQCFPTQSVSGFSRVDDQNVDVTVGPRDVYRLTLFARSPDIDWSQRIALQSTGGSWICSGLDATRIVPSSLGPQRYPVTQIRKLSPAEVAAQKTRP